MMDTSKKTAAYCGLFCESCSLYIGTQFEPERLEVLAKRYGKEIDEMRCNGCRSDKLSFYCVTCEMKACIREKGLDFCSDCDEYPCQTLKEFQVLMPHRAELFDSLDYVRDHGYEKWRNKMKQDFSCEKCGTVSSVYDSKCRNCGNKPPSPFAERNSAQISETLSKLK